MRLLEIDGLAGLGLVSRGKRLVEVGVKLPRRIIGDIEKRDVGGLCDSRQHSREHETCNEACHDDPWRPASSGQSVLLSGIPIVVSALPFHLACRVSSKMVRAFARPRFACVETATFPFMDDT